jgi:hypothetical protein
LIPSVPHLPRSTQNNILLDTRWAPQHRAAVLALLRAQIRAPRFFYTAANRDEVIGIVAKYTKTTPAVAAKSYDLDIKEEVIARECALPRVASRRISMPSWPWAGWLHHRPPQPSSAQAFSPKHRDRCQWRE